MSKSLEKFKVSIQDPRKLLELSKEKEKTDPKAFEVLKRAGLIMALTAWETYVEDRLMESLEQQFGLIRGSTLGNFFKNKLGEELKRFNTPKPDKVKKLYSDFLGIDDVTEGWKWNNYEPQKVREQLNMWVGLRGDVVHRSKDSSLDSQSHAVKKEDLKKCITFLGDLVDKFDEYLEKTLSISDLIDQMK